MLPFYTLDVFTETRFGGNPLAVVLDADGLDTAQMQRIAREFNLSETVFVQKTRRADCVARARIFTPGKELPFAGHPTVGTACLLAELERAPVSGAAPGFALEEGAGPVPVQLRQAPGRPWFASLTAPAAPQAGPPPPADEVLAAMLQLEPGQLGSEGERPRFASCGLPFLLIPVRSPEALSAAELDQMVWRAHLATAWAHQVYVYARDYEGGLRARMFGPGIGIVEDPATGSAAVALAGALAQEATLADGPLRWSIQQGLEMGRPSLLLAEADKAGGQVVAVRVGGHAVRVMEGHLQP